MQRAAWDVVTVRAVGSLAEIVELALPLLREAGGWSCWRRETSADDLRAELRDAGSIIRACGGGRPRVAAVPLAELAGHRLVVVRKERPDARDLPALTLRGAVAAAERDRRERAATGGRRGRACDERRDGTATLPGDARGRALRHPSNVAALDAVLEAVGPVDGLWVLGDIVGYGPDPDAVVDAAAGARRAVRCAGNHDAAVLGRASTAMSSTAWPARPWSGPRRSASAATLAWLEALPERRVEGDFTLVHGSPREPMWEYLFSMPAARRSFGAFDDAPLPRRPHPHQLVFRDDDGHIEAVIRRGMRSRLVLDGRRCILNPGSVGQPRDGDPRACAMMIDTEPGRSSGGAWPTTSNGRRRSSGRSPFPAAWPIGSSSGSERWSDA